jgi:hypothetical protein
MIVFELMLLSQIVCAEIADTAGNSRSETKPIQLHCPPTDPRQAPYYCPPTDDPDYANSGQPPDALVDCLVPVEVHYYDNDGHLQKGTIVVNRDLAYDPKTSITDIFDKIREFNTKRIKEGKSFFPIPEICPEIKCTTDNYSSAYQYRASTGSTDTSNLSMHAYARAIDINPMANAFVKTTDKGTTISPEGASYPGSTAPGKAVQKGSFDGDVGNAIVKIFKDHGWEWGGDWTSPKDYMHFQYPGFKGQTKIKEQAKSGVYCNKD